MWLAPAARPIKPASSPAQRGNFYSYPLTASITMGNEGEKWCFPMSIHPIEAGTVPISFDENRDCPLPRCNRGFFASFTRLHHDQHGAISIVSVFAVLLLTMLLGMIMNVGRQVDGKIRMQNAADDAAYTGGVMLARGMNALAFTNHLLCDVFALTAFMEESRDLNSVSYVPRILAAWQATVPIFAKSNFPKFQALGSAIAQKVPLEQAMVNTYGQWAAATSAEILPLLQEILNDELIPQYQRAVVAAFPDMAQSAALAVAQQNSPPEAGRGPMAAALWLASGEQLGGNSGNAGQRILPVIDPELDAPVGGVDYKALARAQRSTLAYQYLSFWNSDAMLGFDNWAKMSQFGILWRSFTCGYLDQLLAQYSDTNLPQLILPPPDPTLPANDYLQQYFTVISVVYWKKLPEMGPAIFTNPMPSDAVTFAKAHLFIPQPRLVWRQIQARSLPKGLRRWAACRRLHRSSCAGDSTGSGSGTTGGAGRWLPAREPVPAAWDLLTQRWTAQFAAATQSSLVNILQTAPVCRPCQARLSIRQTWAASARTTSDASARIEVRDKR